MSFAIVEEALHPVGSECQRARRYSPSVAPITIIRHRRARPGQSLPVEACLTRGHQNRRAKRGRADPLEMSPATVTFYPDRRAKTCCSVAVTYFGLVLRPGTRQFDVWPRRAAGSAFPWRVRLRAGSPRRVVRSVAFPLPWWLSRSAPSPRHRQRAGLGQVRPNRRLFDSSPWRAKLRLRHLGGLERKREPRQADRGARRRGDRFAFVGDRQRAVPAPC